MNRFEACLIAFVFVIQWWRSSSLQTPVSQAGRRAAADGQQRAGRRRVDTEHSTAESGSSACCHAAHADDQRPAATTTPPAAAATADDWQTLSARSRPTLPPPLPHGRLLTPMCVVFVSPALPHLLCTHDSSRGWQSHPQRDCRGAAQSAVRTHTHNTDKRMTADGHEHARCTRPSASRVDRGQGTCAHRVACTVTGAVRSPFDGALGEARVPVHSPLDQPARCSPPCPSPRTLSTALHTLTYSCVYVCACVLPLLGICTRPLATGTATVARPPARPPAFGLFCLLSVR